jgi:hypothetical protein
MLLPADVDVAGFTVPTRRYNGSLDFGGVLTHLGSEHRIHERVRFSPLNVIQTPRFGIRFRAANAALAARYGIVVPAFEPLDIALALPIRRTRAKARALAAARHALAMSAANEA